MNNPAVNNSGVYIFSFIAVLAFYGVFVAYVLTKRGIVKSLERASKLLKPGMSESEVDQTMMRYIRFPDVISTYERSWGNGFVKSYSVKCPGIMLAPLPLVVGHRAVCVQLYFRDGALEHTSICVI